MNNNLKTEIIEILKDGYVEFGNPDEAGLNKAVEALEALFNQRSKSLVEDLNYALMNYANALKKIEELQNKEEDE